MVSRKETPALLFSCEFCEIFKNTFERLLLYFETFTYPIFLDKRMAALARLSGALDTTIEILKAFSKQSKLLISVMPLLKLYSSSSKCFFMVYSVKYFEGNLQNYVVLEAFNIRSQILTES